MINLEEQNNSKVKISKMEIRFIDLQECNNFTVNYLYKDLLKTITESGPLLSEIDAMQSIHYCPHTQIWPLDDLQTVRSSLVLQLQSNLADDSMNTDDQVHIF